MVNDGKIFSKLKSLKILDEVFKLLVMKGLLITTFMSGRQPPEVDVDDGGDSVGDDNYNDDGDDDAFARLLDIFWIHGYPFVPCISFGYLDTLLYSGNILPGCLYPGYLGTSSASLSHKWPSSMLPTRFVSKHSHFK